MSLRVERTLGLAQLQDGGRFGVRHLGVTQGGALDWVAQYWANWLLGNPLAAAVVEIPLGGLTLCAEADTTLALCGAELAASLDGVPLPAWASFAVRAGQRLEFGPPRQGVRGYLAAPGGFEAPGVLGACATVTREGLGGLHGDGRSLAVGDRLAFAAAKRATRAVPPALRPEIEATAVLDLLPGAQIGDFAGLSLFEAFNAEWHLDARSDRMGARLRGPVLRYQGAPMVSEGIPLGAVQVPPDGQPIALLNDRQTIGGYPRLGALTPTAVARLAQVPAGSPVRLRPVAQGEARRRLLALLAQWQA
ncbi:5-oxoprolinase subunit C family protein [Stutzerimonas tarimensis]|uniref:Biotin-dependent carboxyltransferase family protein n=1 Tax=Stutzerimonas tarimensis TaxID=1507735 RepID=A0ABV7T4J4_9GAMM